MLSFGWKAGTEQYPPEELIEYAVAAENAGFDSVSASDHFHPWAEKGQACFVWSWLGALAAASTRVTLGTGLTCPILRYNPAIIAQAAATVARLAPDRFFLGVGTGEALNEYPATGQWPSYKVRQQQLAEAIELMRKLWTGEKVTHRGAYYQTRQAKLYTLPGKAIPVYVSAMVPNSAYFAGQHGDGLMTVAGEEDETYHEMFQNFEAGARDAGKDPSRMSKLIEVGVSFTDDVEKAVEARREYWAGTFVPALFTERIYTPQMSQDNGKVVGSDTMQQSLCISTDPNVHVNFLQRYIDLGFDHLSIHSAGPDQLAFIEHYGRDVLPRLRDKNRGQLLRAA